jgi:hypothetical protein
MTRKAVNKMFLVDIVFLGLKMLSGMAGVFFAYFLFTPAVIKISGSLQLFLYAVFCVIFGLVASYIFTTPIYKFQFWYEGYFINHLTVFLCGFGLCLSSRILLLFLAKKIVNRVFCATYNETGFNGVSNHAPGVPHGHLEIYAPGAARPTTNNHIPFSE